jgi:RNA-binding protein
VIKPGMKRRLKRKFSAERPTVWIGKEGATQRILDEIDRQLEQHEVMKVKILKTALKEIETKEIATQIATQTNSALIEIRGHTFILHRKRKGKKIQAV